MNNTENRLGQVGDSCGDGEAGEESESHEQVGAKL